MARRKLKLGAVLVGVGDGSTPELWRHPDVPTDASIDIDWYVRQAREAEESGFDFVFIVDSQYVEPSFPNHHLNRLEPSTLLAAVAARTSQIGLIATVSTTYSEPFDIARRLGSLDLISRGRAGWNIVTSQDPGTAGNFGRDAHEDYPTRYRRALESVETVTALWDSYEPDAFSTDKTAERFLDPAKQHRIDHVGEFFRVTGPLNLIGSRQGHPVLVQAGTSPEGRDLSARVGEIVFNFAPDLEWGVAFTEDIRSRLAAYDRDPGDVLIVPGLTIVVGDTDADARRIYEARKESVALPPLLFQLGRAFGGRDFTGYDLDAPFPDVDASREGGALGGAAAIKQRALDEGLTLRQTLRTLQSDHWATFVGAPATIAAEIERWYAAGAADGFNLFVQHPEDFARFRAEVLPLLVARGLFRTTYEGDTLRANLELPVPLNRHAHAAPVSAPASAPAPVAR
ncbi:NtaA/DmoA family FMN-dependent monooxygenase [Herbiconiux daphne]|uniref:NtaA/DmoA family FMN-dependent monooxygenase n=1 Tax=Herbiconiux daphne TaxID=2970914 RepID=A0ABT2H2M0_9MICO|nr:NtaA/DmoA family FMN-dependent monooxygenase [Herbiconiux daphne]MCS5734164.1 NtaA/DmoA family FMN-dependent monooxygenase [Herbiconiux daphne]